MSDFPHDQVTRRAKKHPSIFEPATLVLGVLMAVLGGVIGIQLLTRVGITPNSSVIGAVVAMTLARIPLAVLRPFGSLERQNLLQTVISGATFGGANALLLPIGIPWVLGRPDLVLPMFLGAFAGLVIDATILYRIFDSPAYPASGLWPSGVATAEVLIAGDQGGRRAGLLLAGGSVGGIGQLFGIPMDVFGVCWIGNAYALSMFALGLLLRGYMPALIGVDLSEIYMPHGLMIGAGAVALIQVVMIVRGNLSDSSGAKGSRPSRTNRVLVIGFMAFALAAAGLLFSGGAASEMSVGMILGFVVFTAFAALASELVVGLSAMHAGWFPAFATALIFLVIGILVGFPEIPLALLVGFVSSTGPAFADMGYDLKAGWILRGKGRDPEWERAGRKQQYWAELIGFGVAGALVLMVYESYFQADLIPPLDRVVAATISAGADPLLAKSLLIWAIPGALIQWVGGPSTAVGCLARYRAIDPESDCGLDGGCCINHSQPVDSKIRKRCGKPDVYSGRWLHRWICPYRLRERRLAGEALDLEVRLKCKVWMILARPLRDITGIFL